MGDYLALTWPSGEPRPAASGLLNALVSGGAWRLAYEGATLLVLVRGRRPPRVQALPAEQGVVIGEVFDRRATDAGHVAPFDLAALARLKPVEAASVLTRRAWGGYVAVLSPGDPAPWIFRDPLGGLDCVTWRRDQMTVVSNAGPSPPLHPQGLAIDWVHVADILRDGALSSAVLGLKGLTPVGAGTIYSPQGLGGIDIQDSQAV